MRIVVHLLVVAAVAIGCTAGAAVPSSRAIPSENRRASPEPNAPVTVPAPMPSPPGSDAPSPASPTPTRHAGSPAPPPLLATLCAAAAAGDRNHAEEAFGRAHDGLHTLARELQEAGEREAAGELLEAKQRVEAALVADQVPDDLHDRLDTLSDATAEALEAAGTVAAACPGGS